MHAQFSSKRSAAMQSSRMHAQSSNRRAPDAALLATPAHAAPQTMESLVRLVADAAAPIDEDARDELAAQLAGMYQACALQDGGANLDHIMNPERHARAAGGTANLINNMSNVVRSAIFGKQRWGNVFEQE
eukprot:TRINITY_DN6432_c0_g1_i5.p3 TRINITY_DN6432_c0_g1~~TRINITY_DN6432_c0_g1_i5.p3  ORF type:complete len:131 (-),score=54.51 TRINITY_DN6432_c0_g1_i5:1548-1940(-)